MDSDLDRAVDFGTSLYFDFRLDYIEALTQEGRRRFLYRFRGARTFDVKRHAIFFWADI